MLISKVVYNYTNSILIISGAKIAAIQEELVKLNELVGFAQDNFNQKFFKSAQGKKALIEAAGKLKFETVIINLLIKLTSKGQLSLLPLICNYLPELVMQKEGVSSAQVKSVIALSNEEERSIADYIQNSFAKKVQITNIIDPSILGGVVVSFESLLLDNSVASKLEKAKRHLAKQ
jgi:F-type H+-transporting ATPase subunit delta